MTKLKANVWVDGRLYRKGTTPPASVAQLISNPKAWDGRPPVAASGPNGSDVDAAVERERALTREALRRAEAAEAEVARLTTQLEHFQIPDPSAPGAGPGDGLGVQVAGEPGEHADSVPVQEPPRGGPGSSERAWREFLTAQSIDVPEGASREDLHALWDLRKPS